jgi:uncharacterized protein
VTGSRVVSVGIVADTHLEGDWDPVPFRRLLAGPFAHVSRILHAGDILDYDGLVHSALPGLPIDAVAGNCDPNDDLRLPAQRIVEVEGFRIGLIHGWGAVSEVPRKAAGAFAGQPVDAVVFGHTHRPHLETLGGITYFNPGSMLWPRGAQATVGLLVLTDGRPQFSHLVRDIDW